MTNLSTTLSILLHAIYLASGFFCFENGACIFRSQCKSECANHLRTEGNDLGSPIYVECRKYKCVCSNTAKVVTKENENNPLIAEELAVPLPAEQNSYRVIRRRRGRRNEREVDGNGNNSNRNNKTDCRFNDTNKGADHGGCRNDNDTDEHGNRTANCDNKNDEGGKKNRCHDGGNNSRNGASHGDDNRTGNKSRDCENDNGKFDNGNGNRCGGDGKDKSLVKGNGIKVENKTKKCGNGTDKGHRKYNDCDNDKSDRDKDKGSDNDSNNTNGNKVTEIINQNKNDGKHEITKGGDDNGVTSDYVNSETERFTNAQETTAIVGLDSTILQEAVSSKNTISTIGGATTTTSTIALYDVQFDKTTAKSVAITSSLNRLSYKVVVGAMAATVALSGFVFVLKAIAAFYSVGY